MIARRRLWALGVAVLLAVPAAAEDPKDAVGDPLPKGATGRLGSTRLRDASGWSGFALAADGRSLVAIPQERGGLIKIDVTTGLATSGTPTQVSSGQMELSANGMRAVLAGFGGPVVFDVDNGVIKATIDRTLPYGRYGAAVSADGKLVAVGGVTEKDKKVSVLVWDVEKNAQRKEVEVLQNESASVALSADGTVLATWGSHSTPNRPGAAPKPDEEYGKVVQFWDAGNRKERAKHRINGFGVLNAAVSPDGRTAAVAANGGGALWLIDTATGALSRQLFGRSDLGARLVFSPDGKRLAVIGFDGAVQIYGADTGERTSLTECPVGALSGGAKDLRFTSNTTAVAWGTVNSAAVVWEVPSGRLLSPPGGHTGSVESVAFTPDGKAVLTASRGTVLRWDPSTGKQTGTVRLRKPGKSDYDGGPFWMRLSPDAQTVKAGGGFDGSAAVFDAASGAQLFSLRGASEFGSEPTLCADGRTVLIVPPPPNPVPRDPPKSMRVPVWDTRSGKKLTELEPRFGTLVAAATSPDRTKAVTLIAVRSGDGNKEDYYVTGWDLATGTKLGEIQTAAEGGLKYLIATPDNATALVAAGVGKLAVVDFVVGKAVREIDTENQTPTAVSLFSPDCKWFAVGTGYSSRPTVWVYEWKSGKRARTFHGHAAGILCLAFSPDGKQLASGSQDTTVLLWDLAAK
jgi:WD40 repeat protein